MDITDWIPWLLIVFGAPERAQEDYQIVMVEVAADEAECAAMGVEYMNARASADEEASQAQRFVCTRMPARDSFNAALGRWIEKQAEALRPE